jgi:hypothetical protein
MAPRAMIIMSEVRSSDPVVMIMNRPTGKTRASMRRRIPALLADSKALPATTASKKPP